MEIMFCPICKQRKIEQEHHIKYDPEIKIPICVICHQHIHEHGVGLPKNKNREKSYKNKIKTLLKDNKYWMYKGEIITSRVAHKLFKKNNYHPFDEDLKIITDWEVM